MRGICRPMLWPPIAHRRILFESSDMDREDLSYVSQVLQRFMIRAYPLILAGGAAMGLKHGRYLKFSDQVPMSNLFVTMLNRTGVECPVFADSTGELDELLS